VSLILAYHNSDFGVLCSDGRVSIRQSDGSHVASHNEVGTKFVVLKPNLILAGSSSWSAALDYYIFEEMRKFVQASPALTFREIANIIPTIVGSADGLLPIPPGTATNLTLLGYDADERRVRNVAFGFMDGAHERSEHVSGAVASGFIDTAEEIPRRILDGMGDERTIDAARGSMIAIARELAEKHPNVIGAPYFFHVIKRHEERQAA
jgi:hypothetical protein